MRTTSTVGRTGSGEFHNRLERLNHRADEIVTATFSPRLHKSGRIGRNAISLATSLEDLKSRARPSTTKVTPADYTVSLLVQSIGRGKVALPDIQRPFVWQPAKVRALPLQAMSR